jgi:hypothetical protein
MAAMFIVASVSTPLYGQNDSENNRSKLAKFEIDFAEYRINQAGTEAPSDDSAVIHLTGFVTTILSDSDKSKISKKQIPLGPNFYLSADSAYVRIYTFLRDGEIEYEGKSYTADARGIVKLASSVDVSKIKILGKKTDKGDIIGGKYMLSSFYQYSNRKIAVYDLGVKK